MTEYYDDLSIGQTWTEGEYTVTKEEILEFGQKYDPQPLHADEDAANESMFGGLIASGVHSIAIATRLYVASAADIANLAGIGMDEVRFHQPVRPGDTLTLEIEILKKSPSDSKSDRGYVEIGRTLTNSEDETVLSYVALVIVERTVDGA